MEKNEFFAWAGVRLRWWILMEGEPMFDYWVESKLESQEV